MILRILTIIVLIGIAYFSLKPEVSLPVENDKVGHFIAYAVLMLHIGLLTYTNKKYFLLGISFALFYGMLMEGIQYFIPGRTTSVYDLIANSVGVLIGIVIILLFNRPLLRILKQVKII